MHDAATRNTCYRVHPGWHDVGGMLVLIWLVTMWLMFAGGKSEGEVCRLSAGDLSGTLAEGEEWMGVYQRSRKLGYIHSTIRNLPGGFRLEQDSRLVLRVGGVEQEIYSNLDVWLGKNSLLERFHFAVESSALDAAVEGTLTGNRLALELRLGNLVERLISTVEEPPLFEIALPKVLARQDLSPGRRYRLRMFDPQTLSNRSVTIEVVGSEVIPVQGRLTPAIHLRRVAGGIEVDSWIDEQGLVLKEEYAFGLMLRREDRETATSAGEGLKVDGRGEDAAELLRLLLPGSFLSRRRP